MTIEKTLCATKREGSGKCAAHQDRAQGLIPGVYYNAKGENIKVNVPSLPLEQLYFAIGETVCFNLEIDDNGEKTTRPVFFWGVQKHPYKKKFVHIDYYGVDLDQEVQISVPVKYVGQAKGQKLGGKLETFRDQLLIAAKPLDMPKVVNIDITEMGVNEVLSIEKLVLPEGARAIYDQNFTLVSITAAVKEETPEEAAKPAKKGKK